MEENKNNTMIVLEQDAYGHRLYHSWYKAEYQMLKDWFEGSVEEDLNDALALLEKIGKGTNDSYDLDTVRRIVRYVKNDLHDALYDGYIDSCAYIYTAEVAD